MPKMIVSIDDVVIKEVQLTKELTTLGRRPYNDIVIDNLAVSGEHAVLKMAGAEVYLEDLDSTNGTYVNGRAIQRHLLQNGDTVEIGKYKIQFVGDAPGQGVAQTLALKAASAKPAPVVAATTPMATSTAAGAVTQAGGLAAPHAAIKVLSGAAAGREVPLLKVVTTIGKPGIAVAAITRRHRGFEVHHVEGAGNPTLNGAPIGLEPLALKNGDLIELAGTQMQFVQT